MLVVREQRRSGLPSRDGVARDAHQRGQGILLDAAALPRPAQIAAGHPGKRPLPLRHPYRTARMPRPRARTTRADRLFRRPPTRRRGSDAGEGPFRLG